MIKRRCQQLKHFLKLMKDRYFIAQYVFGEIYTKDSNEIHFITTEKAILMLFIKFNLRFLKKSTNSPPAQKNINTINQNKTIRKMCVYKNCRFSNIQFETCFKFQSVVQKNLRNKKPSFSFFYKKKLTKSNENHLSERLQTFGKILQK